MSVQDIIADAIGSQDTDLKPKQVLELLLPTKERAYSLDEIEARLYQFRDQLEHIQRNHNDRFDSVLNKAATIKIDNLNKSLHSTQLEIMKLHCDIAFTKEQLDTVQTICDNPLVNERRELLRKQEKLSKLLQQQKFLPLREFYDRYIGYIGSTLDVCRKICSRQSSEYNQLFDWAQYHQSMFLLRACGKIIQDLRNFEILYLNRDDVMSIKFKQPMDRVDLNNFIEFPQAYTIESQLDICTRTEQFVSFEPLLARYSASLDTPDVKYEVFKESNDKLIEITKNCCSLMMDLNMNYIEANLTDGVNIDKLNGDDGTSSTSVDPMPLYAFSPQEYITKIGQHLLNLRKQTEQFDSVDNKSLKIALKFLRGMDFDIQISDTITDIIMRSVTRNCVKSLLGRTGRSILSKLTLNGKRQLATDVSYLASVLEDMSLLDADDSTIIKFKNLMIQ